VMNVRTFPQHVRDEIAERPPIDQQAHDYPVVTPMEDRRGGTPARSACQRSGAPNE
jgi:hypothetical protein